MALSIAEVNSARALRGLNVSGLDPHPIETGDPVIVNRENLRTLGTPQQQRTILQTFSSAEESSNFYSNMTKVGWSVSVGMEASFPMGSISVEGSASKEETNKRTDEFKKEVKTKVVTEFSYVPRASFRISKSDMILTGEALEDAARVVDMKTAMGFLHKYKSHVSTATYTVGGIFTRESEVSSTKTHKASVLTYKGMMKLGLKAEASVFMVKMKASSEFSQEDEREAKNTNDSDIETSTERTHVLGPTSAGSLLDFLGKVNSGPSEWVIIDKDVEKGRELVGVWEIMKKQKEIELEDASVWVCECWQDMAWNFRESDPLIKQVFDLSKDTFDREGLLPWEGGSPAPRLMNASKRLNFNARISSSAEVVIPAYGDIDVVAVHPDLVDFAPVFVYAGDILLDKPLKARPSLSNQTAKRFIDNLRHRINLKAKESDKDDDSDWSDGEVEVQDFSLDHNVLLHYVLDSSDFLARIAICSLLLESRSSVPLVTWSSTTRSESSTLCHSADVLSFVAIGTSDLNMSLVENTDLPRVAFISEVPSSKAGADMVNSLLGCKFYAEETTGLRTPTVEVAVGFLASANSPCIGLLVLGDYRGGNGKVLEFLQDANVALVLETKGAGSSPDTFKSSDYFMQWELVSQGENKTDKESRKITGETEYIKGRLSKHLAGFFSKRKSMHSNKTLQGACSHHFPASIGIMVPDKFKNFDWSNLKANLKLQKGFQEVFKLEWEIMDRINDPSSMHPLESKRDKIKDNMVSMVKDIVKLPVIRAFYGVLTIKEDMKRKAAFMVLQREIVRHTKMLGSANLWREMSIIHLQHPMPELVALAGQHALDGFPLEIFDGDAGMVCLPWVEDILAEIEHRAVSIHNKIPKVFVISVLGLPNSGKDTLLSTMFGPKLQASYEQHSRGVSIQLIPVDQRSEYDYVLLVDTDPKGLGPPSANVLHANRLAAFCMLVSDVCVWMLPDVNDKEGCNRLKGILQMIMMAFRGSVLAQYYSGPMRTKLMFVQQCEGMEGDMLSSVNEGLQTYVKDAATKVANMGLSDTESVDPSTIISQLKVSNEQEQSDVKFLGSPGIPATNGKLNFSYGETVMKMREYMHDRVTQEPGYEAITLTVWNQIIQRVWQTMNDSNFELSFRSIAEYSSWREVTENVISKFYNKLDAAFLTAFEEAISKKGVNFVTGWADLHASFMQLLEPIHQQVAEFLQGSQWKAQKQANWANFCDELIEEYKLRFKDAADNGYVIERKGLEILKHRMRKNIQNLEDTINHDNLIVKEQAFQKLFDSLIIKDSGCSIFLKHIEDRVVKMYQSYQSVSRRLDLFEEGTENLNGNLRASLKLMLKFHTISAEQYSSKVVLDVIAETDNRLWGYSRSQQQAAHIWMMSALIDKMKARQEQWSHKRNHLADMLNKEKESFRKVFNGCLVAKSFYNTLTSVLENNRQLPFIDRFLENYLGFGFLKLLEAEAIKCVEHHSIGRFLEGLIAALQTACHEQVVYTQTHPHNVAIGWQPQTHTDLSFVLFKFGDELFGIKDIGELDAAFNLIYAPLLLAALSKRFAPRVR